MSLEVVQRELGLGPNGGLVYCLDYLAQNLDWLEAALAPLEAGATRALVPLVSASFVSWQPLKYCVPPCDFSAPALCRGEVPAV